jgi:hypothetical protein
MTFHTFPFGYVAIPLNDAKMALFAGHSSCNIFPMIKTPTIDFDIPFGLDVTRGAATHGT